MELQQEVDSLERQVKKQGRFLRLTSGLLILTIGVLITRWVLATEGRLDVQGKRVYVHGGERPLTTATIRPPGVEAHSFDDPSEPYGRHVLLGVTPEGTQLSLTQNFANQNRDLKRFVAGDRSGLSIRDNQQRERISLTLSDDGPKLRLLDENGQAIFQAP